MKNIHGIEKRLLKRPLPLQNLSTSGAWPWDTSLRASHSTSLCPTVTRASTFHRTSTSMISPTPRSPSPTHRCPTPPSIRRPPSRRPTRARSPFPSRSEGFHEAQLPTLRHQLGDGPQVFRIDTDSESEPRNQPLPQIRAQQPQAQTPFGLNNVPIPVSSGSERSRPVVALPWRSRPSTRFVKRAIRKLRRRLASISVILSP